MSRAMPSYPRRPAFGSRAAGGIATLAVLTVGLVGCAPSGPPPGGAGVRTVASGQDHGPEHGHTDDHDHPKTLAAAVAELESLWAGVREALAKGDRDAADDKVHMVGHLLEDAAALAAKEGAGTAEAARKAVDEVFACFDTLDTALHGAADDWKKIDLEGLGTKIDAAFAVLKSPAPAEKN